METKYDKKAINDDDKNHRDGHTQTTQSKETKVTHFSMFFAACFLSILSLPLGRAEDWDDFSNSLVTDVSPLLSVFSEQVTKQYLSKSITWQDYFIFSMAPMGMLTAHCFRDSGVYVPNR